jgi:hypothetical protein
MTSRPRYTTRHGGGGDVFSVVRDLYYLASEAAYVPVRIAQAFAEGIAVGWQTCNPSGCEGVTITRGSGYREWRADQLSDAEAEREAWEMNELHTEAEWLGYKLTASTDGAVTADPAVECSPAAAASATSAAAGHPNDPAPIEADRCGAFAVGAGHPNERLLRSAVFGLKEWMTGESCDTQTYFAHIVRDLEQLYK